MKPITSLPSFPEFANINPGVAPGEPKYSQGFVPADTFPAEWANYLFNRSSKGVTALNEAVDSIWKELGNILSYFNITPDGTEYDQLLEALKKIPPHFAQCQTAANTQNKSIAVENDVLKAGNVYVIDMTYGNTYGDGSTTYPTLSINSGTAYPLCDANGKYLASGAWAAGDTIKVLFTGSKYLMATRAVTDAVTNGDKSPVTSDAVFQLISNQFDILWPIGSVYTQYPMQKSPNELWGDLSTWEELNYGGAFFRAAGGNAETFERQLMISNFNGTTITFSAAHGLTVGSVIYDFTHNEGRVVTAVQSTTIVTIDTPFNYTNFTNVLITQNSQNLSHSHTTNSLKNKTGTADITTTPSGGSHTHKLGFSDFGSTLGATKIYMAAASAGATDTYKNYSYATQAVLSDQSSHTHNIEHLHGTTTNGGTETRTVNYSYKVWKRVS